MLDSKTPFGGIAANEKRAYFNLGNSIQVIDRQTQTIAPFPLGARIVLYLNYDVHLVRYQDEPKNEAHAYDFKHEVDLGKIQMPANYSNDIRYSPKVSPNLRFIVFFKGFPREEWVQNRTIKTEFILYDLVSGTVRSLPILIYVKHQPKSNIDPYLVKMSWGFGTDGKSFRYVTARVENESAPDIESLQGGFEEVVLDLERGNEIRKEGHPSTSMECPSSCRVEYYVPDFLKNESIESPQDVVRGLLDLLKIDHNINRDTRFFELGLSLDKKRFLASIPMKGGNSQLFFGDLDKRVAIKVNTPADMILEDNSIHAITVPGEASR